MKRTSWRTWIATVGLLLPAVASIAGTSTADNTYVDANLCPEFAPCPMSCWGLNVHVALDHKADVLFGADSGPVARAEKHDFGYFQLDRVQDQTWYYWLTGTTSGQCVTEPPCELPEETIEFVHLMQRVAAGNATWEDVRDQAVGLLSRCPSPE